MVVSRSIHINAPVERVFALMCDPGQRARLNPDAIPLRVEIEDDQRLHMGSVCHFRLKIGQRIVGYRSRVREFIPDLRIISVSDTAIPFEITIETLPEDGGTRLIQTEVFEPSDEMLVDAAPPPGVSGRLARLIAWALPFLDTDTAQDERHREERVLRQKLEGNLDRWLAAIRRHLETPPG
jgi:uncharacterized protein YndB with AHSA1/START domain